ncbi:MAG: 50S ribosomal protein L3 [Candidatus Woesearchaeota archaeon]
MPKSHKPRSGSMQYWPRKRAKKPLAKIRSWAKLKDAKLSGFAGYKVGMTHVLIEDTRKFSKTKGEKISVPVSIIECPPLKIYSVRFYKKVYGGLKIVNEVLIKTNDKELQRSVVLPKKDLNKLEDVKVEDFDELRVIVYTQPKFTNIGTKKPSLFELTITGSNDIALEYVKSNINKTISINDIFSAGQLVDFHTITKGKGFQGPVKRFGVSIRSHKSEKTKRGPGSISGGWISAGHMMYRVAKAGQMGYHMRTEYNKQIFAIENDVKKINPKGGFIRFGVVKSDYILVKGSVGGSKKRLLKFCFPIRKNRKISEEAPKILDISLESKQGR